MEVGEKEICFLDLKITIDSNNQICTTVYSKPTDSHLYLHPTSCHPTPVIHWVAKGVALRLRRLCSSDSEFDTKSSEYLEYLSKRNYNRDKVGN